LVALRAASSAVMRVARKAVWKVVLWVQSMADYWVVG
jgi:hypothetical protein